MTEDESLGHTTAPSTLITRRTFVGASVAVGGAAVALPLLQGCGDDERVASHTTGAVRIRINGEDRDVTVDNRTSLLDMLREQVGLTGTKKAATKVRAVRARYWSTISGSCRA